MQAKLDLEKSISERCHINSNDEGDSFVGVKADTDDVVIYFPIGYQLPESDDEIRQDINNLLFVLSAFMKEDCLIEESKFEAPRTVDFPMHAYLKVIRDFLRTGRYFIETEPQYKTGIRGSANWARTVQEQKPLVQKNGSFVFPKMTVRSVSPNENKQITQIHRYCVYEAFSKMGWLYVPYMPELPGPHPGIKESIYILNQKLASTYNDSEQELFSAMRDMLRYMDEKNMERQFFFGTDYFERIWERMIDKAFGSPNKDLFFPKTKWFLNYGPTKNKVPLQPDSIMFYKGKTYVLDAKFYRYGWTANPDHLPNGQDINKQITYAEYIENLQIDGVHSNNLYNAFIMPFNKEDNKFKIESDGKFIPAFNGMIGNVGEAIGEWRTNLKKYERIQGIVIDTRFLMYNYISMPNSQKEELAMSIEKISNNLGTQTR